MSQKQFAFIVIITFIVIIIWVASDIYHVRPSVQLSADMPSLIEPIDPGFNKNILKQIQENFKNSEPLPSDNPSVSSNSASPENISPVIPLPESTPASGSALKKPSESTGSAKATR